MRRHIIRVLPIAILAAAALSLAACGDDSTSDTGATTEPATTETQTSTGGGATALTIVMTDYEFTPKNATAAAGSVTLTAPNNGAAPHELVLIRTALSVDKLPTASNGDVDEDAFPANSLPGEIGETEPGQTGTLTVDLPAGRYVMLCNVSGHYQKGMVGNLVVK